MIRPHLFIPRGPAINGRLQHEQDTGTEMEFDRVAIRCDFSEYPSAMSAASEYAAASDIPNHCEEAALEWLNDHTLTIPFDGGVIIQCF